MPSLVWRMTQEEAQGSPYEYAVREQFFREAGTLLDALYLLLHAGPFRFTIDDRTVEKAIWLLHADTQDTLREILVALQEKRHRIAAKLFRFALEALDLAAYFHAKTPSSSADLSKWYEGNIVAHAQWRGHLKNVGKAEAAAARREVYTQMSRHVHGAYPAILFSYIAGGSERNYMVHDGYQAVVSDRGFEARDFLVHPQVVSQHCSTLADLILLFTEELVNRQVVPASDIAQALRSSLETDTVPRRFELPTQPTGPTDEQPREP